VWAAALSVAGVVLGYALHSFVHRKQTVPPVEHPTAHPRQPDDRFDRLVRALPLGVLMLDRHSRVTFANRAAGAIFGFDRARIRGAHVLEAVPSVELERRVDEALDGEASMGPLIVTGKSGNRTYGVSAYPLTDDSEQTNGVLVLAEDQTELIAMERARQEFLSNVSHELRTPLSSIKLMLETVVASADEEVRDLFVPQALTQVDRLAALVQKFLEQARAESGQLNLKIARVALEPVVRPIVQSFEPNARGKNVELVLRVKQNPQADVDPDRIAQIVVNLLDNALRFTPEGGTIKVDLDQKDADAVIVVRDTGIGIPYKDLPHIFDRFYVVDRSRARDVAGVGLGLSIVKQIVEAHRGSIAAESLLGSGAKFTCRIPLRAEVPGTP
jgi:two-component system phosphate regulon sensor histidine kinase PhoR